MATMNRADCEEAVSRPGKFEGERPYVPFYWDILLDGGADEEDGDVAIFRVTDEDRATFPELAGRETVRIYERSDGFVCEC